MIPRLKELYKKEIQTNLKSKLGLKNNLMTPRLVKIVLNMGLGNDGNDSKILKMCEEDLSKITGQKPVITKFIERLVNIALPRIKDFRGLSAKGFDNFGNYTFGIKEHIIFPEVNFDKVDKIRGLDITIVISSRNRDHSYELLKKLNFPFKTERNN